MIVLKIILWVLLALLVLLAVAFMIPVAVEVKYTDDVKVTVKYLFLKFVVAGEKTNKQHNKKPKKKDTSKSNKAKNKPAQKDSTSLSKKTGSSKTTDNGKSDKSKKNKKAPKKENAAVKWLKTTFKKKGLQGVINAFKEIARLAGTFLKPIFKHFRVKKLDIGVIVASDNAADTAINYGYFCAGIYPALAVILKIVRCDDYSVNIKPDFDKKEPEYDITAELSLIPWFAAAGALHALFNFLRLKAQGKL